MAFLISAPLIDFCKYLGQILLTNGTFASGLFNLGASNGLLKIFGFQCQILLTFEPLPVAFLISVPPKDSCKHLAQILLTNGTFACGLFNLGSSNGLLKIFGSSYSGFV